MSKQTYRFTVFITVFFLATAYLFVFSGSGLLERISVQNRIDSLEDEISKTKENNRLLEKEYQAYKYGQLKPEDLYDSGFIKPGDKVILFEGLDDKEQESARRKKIQSSLFSIASLRIVWAIISGMVMIVLYVFRPGNDEHRI